MDLGNILTGLGCSSFYLGRGVVRYEERGGRGRCVDGAHWANTGKPPVSRSPTLVSFGGGVSELNHLPTSYVCSPSFSFAWRSLMPIGVASGLN